MKVEETLEQELGNCRRLAIPRGFPFNSVGDFFFVSFRFVLSIPSLLKLNWFELIDLNGLRAEVRGQR